MTVSGTPGTGTITLGSGITDATNGDLVSMAASYGANATVDCLFVDGNKWSIERNCSYTHSGTTLARGTVERTWNGSSLSTSALSLTSAAKVYVILTAERAHRLINNVCFQISTGTAKTSYAATWTYYDFTSAEFSASPDFDILSGWNSSTARYTPTIAGKYEVEVIADVATASSTHVGAGLNLSGSILKSGQSSQSGGTGRVTTASVKRIIEMNGSTDYIAAASMVSVTSGNSGHAAIIVKYLGN